jgi:hypothetical protein
MGTRLSKVAAFWKRMFPLWLLVLTTVTATGCSAPDFAKASLPLNAGAAYFGTVGIHEGGHVLAAEVLAADSIRVDFLPTRDREGTFHLGLTTARHDRDWSDRELSWFRASGPTASLLAHIATRELLKSGVVSPYLQPALAWLSFANQISYFGHVGAGILQIESSDLGQEDRWISFAMLVGGVSYELYDIFSEEDNGLRKYKVLIGEDFYTTEKRRNPIRLVTGPGFLGLRWDF